MYLRQLVLSVGLFATVINGQSMKLYDSCQICGPGKVVTKPAGTFEFPNQPTVTCGVLQDAGLQGLLEPKHCEGLPPLLSECGCADGELPVPAPAPRLSSRASTVVCPAVPPTGCSVCGTGQCITAPTGQVSIPGQPLFLCSELEDSGLNGMIPLPQCPSVVTFLTNCTCTPGDPPAPTTLAPVSGPTPPGQSPVASPVAVEPTSPPVPTPAPTLTPTAPPTSAPTSAPTSPPTAVPTSTPAPNLGGNLGKLGKVGKTGKVAAGNGGKIGKNGKTVKGMMAMPKVKAGIPDSQQVPAPRLSTRAGVVCPAVPPTGCSVCGAGQCITAPTPQVDLPGQSPYSCGQLQDGGLTGAVPLALCPSVAAFLTECACAPGDPPAPTSAPTASPTLSGVTTAAPTSGPALEGSPNKAAKGASKAPNAGRNKGGKNKGTKGPTVKGMMAMLKVKAGIPDAQQVPAPRLSTRAGVVCPAVPPTGCSVCGAGQCITAPTPQVDLPGQSPYSCGQLQDGGLTGAVPLALCPSVAPFLTECACAPGDPPASPTAPPTVAEVAAPTSPPVPTSAPEPTTPAPTLSGNTSGKGKGKGKGKGGEATSVTTSDDSGKAGKGKMGKMGMDLPGAQGVPAMPAKMKMSATAGSLKASSATRETS